VFPLPGGSMSEGLLMWMLAKPRIKGDVLQLPMAPQSTTGTVKSCMFWHAMQHWSACQTLLSTPFWRFVGCCTNASIWLPPHCAGRRPRNVLLLADERLRLVQQALFAPFGFVKNGPLSEPHRSPWGMDWNTLEHTASGIGYALP